MTNASQNDSGASEELSPLALERIGKGQYQLEAPWPPAGGQPEAIVELVEGLNSGEQFQTLLGITGSGKSFTLANVIAQTGRPALVLAPNKSLAAQLVSEFREFFPHNQVEYFVSYYDYYQPEAYVPASDTFIDKEATINQEIDRLRHAATAAALTHDDVIIVASVSAIYGLGRADVYASHLVNLRVGQHLDERALLSQFVSMRYTRSDFIDRGRFRVKGDTIEVWPAYAEHVVRIELYDDEIERISILDPVTFDATKRPTDVTIFPASHYGADRSDIETALVAIREERDERLAVLRKAGKLVEAQRLEMRTNNDLEMLEETSWCSGIENYSRHFERRAAGSPPQTLLDYIDDGLLVIVDESHVAVPQMRGAYAGDFSRKQTLVDHGFRLESAKDNRPLRFEEIIARLEAKGAQIIFSSATPGPYELDVSDRLVEQVVRPTGLLDPPITVRTPDGQVDDLLDEIHTTIDAGHRTLVTTLTKKMAEQLTDYLAEKGVRVRYLHSDVETLERIEILRSLRLGEFDVLVGINLLREGLDLPEVALVAILDADKEGFLRSETALLQTVGRAARNSSGRVIMYASKVTPSMRRAIDETNRRRDVQAAYNIEHGITATSVTTGVRDRLVALPKASAKAIVNVGDEVERDVLGARMEAVMLVAAQALKFEEAAMWRDRRESLRKGIEAGVLDELEQAEARLLV